MTSKVFFRCLHWPFIKEGNNSIIANAKFKWNSWLKFQPNTEIPAKNGMFQFCSWQLGSLCLMGALFISCICVVHVFLTYKIKGLWKYTLGLACVNALLPWQPGVSDKRSNVLHNVTVRQWWKWGMWACSQWWNSSIMQAWDRAEGRVQWRKGGAEKRWTSRAPQQQNGLFPICFLLLCLPSLCYYSIRLCGSPAVVAKWFCPSKAA